MNYSLEFHPSALHEFRNLDNSLKRVFAKKLEERLAEPRIPADRLSGPLSECYKMRIGKTGHRLVYHVIESELVIYVLAVGKREDKVAYQAAITRI